MLVKQYKKIGIHSLLLTELLL